MAQPAVNGSAARAVVHPNQEGLGTDGPRDLDDLIVHNGEARGLADTARHSLEPDAPTVEAAGGNPEPPSAEDLVQAPEIGCSDGAPDG